MSDAADTELNEAFANGDYHKVAASNRRDRWQTFAALGLCGNIRPALDGLGKFDDPLARFYEAVVHWIDGNEDAAAVRLEASSDPHAANLLALIRKPRIHILSQLPWSQFGDGPHEILPTARSSGKFVARNIGFEPGDLRNAANADIRNYVDRRHPPDFYFAQMVEWQLIPPNLQVLNCPIVGQTADFDLHIQAVRPWLQLFDSLIVTDTTEHRDASRLVSCPVATFPKTFNLSKSLPPPPLKRQRDIDVLVTGTAFHPYHHEKAEILHQVMRVPGVNPFIVNGFLHWGEYQAILARSRLSISFIRHPGATPSRGIEALAMGTVLLAQPETTLKLWLGEEHGLLTYDLENQGLRNAIARTLQDSGRHEAAARRGMEIVRHEFEAYRMGQQFLRFATFLAARPRAARRPVEPPRQCRIVAWQGWLQKDNRVYGTQRDQALAALNSIPADQQTPETLNAPCREIMLELARQMRTKPAEDAKELLAATLEIYTLGINLLPNALILRFNFIRAAMHFGAEDDIQQALTVAKETVDMAMADLSLDASDDVMTWDYCASFFNYRSYLDTVTEASMDGADHTDRLKTLILASIHYYLGRMTGEADNFVAAVQLDPDFPAYRLWLAKALVRTGDTESLHQATELLSGLAQHSIYAIEAWSLLKAVCRGLGTEPPDAALTGTALKLLETRTFSSADHSAIRNSSYFRSQRLGLARNSGYETVKSRKKPVRLSVLLADLNGSRYPELVAMLRNQTLARDQFEIVVADAFDCPSPDLLEIADTVIVCGQDEYLYNRNAAFNLTLANASGKFVAIFDRDVALSVDALMDILNQLDGRAGAPTVLVNADFAPGDRANLHFAALDRTRALSLGGFEESPSRTAGLGGPYELVGRLRANGTRTEPTGAVPAAPGSDSSDIAPLLQELWAFRAAPERRIPENENPEIRKLRENRSAA